VSKPSLIQYKMSLKRRWDSNTRWAWRGCHA